MNIDARESCFLPTCEYHPTLIDSRPLPERLVKEVVSSYEELKKVAAEFRQAPLEFLMSGAVSFRRSLTLDRLRGFAFAILILALCVLSLRVFEKRNPKTESRFNPDAQEILRAEIISLESQQNNSDRGVGVNGKGRVGLNRDRGEGSNVNPQKSGGGGSGGNHDRDPAQLGKVPVPSAVQGAIPKTAPLNPPALPAAGIDLDPSLWREIKLPQYGDPRSRSDVPSNGPGEEGGMGTRRGTGIGDGSGPGFGPGNNGNTGGGGNSRGCCGPGSSEGNSPDGWANRIFRGAEVEQRARLLSKPEPQYTEEARRNQITGTVVLRVVFSSAGEVTQIRAITPLPFGLTERAIAAARLIRFQPAIKGGRPVSVQMQLEYNFNLY